MYCWRVELESSTNNVSQNHFIILDGYRRIIFLNILKAISVVSRSSNLNVWVLGSFNQIPSFSQHDSFVLVPPVQEEIQLAVWVSFTLHVWHQWRPPAGWIFMLKWKQLFKHPPSPHGTYVCGCRDSFTSHKQRAALFTTTQFNYLMLTS